MTIHETEWNFMKSDKICMKSAEFYQKISEILWKYIKFNEIFMKSDDIFMKFVEIYQKIYEIPWKSMKFNEILWNLIRFSWNLLKFIETPMKFYENI